MAAWLAKSLLSPPPPLHLLAALLSTSLFSLHTTSICILCASTSPRVSWPPCNEETSSALLLLLHPREPQVKTSSPAKQPSWRLRPDPENQTQSYQAECGGPRSALSRHASDGRESPQSQEKEMNRDNLMNSINQQVSNGNTQTRVRSRAD